MTCPFRLSVINDEISPDFDHACYVASHDFGLRWIELRSLWGKALSELSSSQLTEAIAILDKYSLRVTDLASPLFKTDLPGARGEALERLLDCGAAWLAGANVFANA